MKMKHTEQAVETLDDAGSVIANKNIEIEQLRQRVAELEKELSEVRKAERERVEVMILNGRFLHDQAPTALFAKEVAAAIRAMG